MRIIHVTSLLFMFLAASGNAEVLYTSEGGFETADWILTDAQIADGKILVPADQAGSARCELVGSENWGPCLITMRVEIARSATIHIFAMRDYFFMTNPQAYGDAVAVDWPKIYQRTGEVEGSGVGILESPDRLLVPPSTWTFQWGIVENDLVIRIWPDGETPGSFATLPISGPQYQVGPFWLVLYGNGGDVVVHDLVVEGVGAVASERVTLDKVKAVYAGE